MMEHKLREIGGLKTLISHNYDPEADFWKTWNRANRDAVKARIDPRNVFRTLYAKTCQAAMGRRLGMTGGCQRGDREPPDLVPEVPPLPVVEPPPLPVMELPPLPVVEPPPLPVMELPPLPVMELPPLPVMELPPLPVMELPPLPITELPPVVLLAPKALSPVPPGPLIPPEPFMLLLVSVVVVVVLEPYPDWLFLCAQAETATSHASTRPRA